MNGTVDKLFNPGSCIKSFTETGERPLPTRLHGTSTRSDRGPIEPRDLNKFTIAAVTLKEHDLIDNKHKSGKRRKFSTMSLGGNRVRLTQAVVDENETSLDFTRRVRFKENEKGRRCYIVSEMVP